MYNATETVSTTYSAQKKRVQSVGDSAGRQKACDEGGIRTHAISDKKSGLNLNLAP